MGPTKEVSTNKLSYRTEAEVIGQSPVRAVCRRERLTNRILFSTVLVILSAVPAYPELPGVASLFSSHASPPQSRAAENNALLDQYCVYCHDDDLKEGGLTLAEVDLSQPGQHAAKLELMIRKLRAGMMPPPGLPRPDPAVLKALVADLESGVDMAAAAAPNPGRPVLHRLNRTEYAISIRNLLGLEVNAEALLPPDDMSQGYDNMSDVLTISPSLLEGYMSAAGKISRLAVGDLEATPVVETYVVPQAISQMKHIEGTPFGTRGGMVVRHNFPADGDYTFWMSFYYASIGGFFGDNIQAEGEQIEVSIDGERVAILDIDRKMKTTDDLRTPPIKVTAGPHAVSAAFIKRMAGPVQDFVMPFERALVDLSTGHFPGLTGLPHLRNLGINGPYDITGVSETPSRGKIFTCRPADASEELSCAREILLSMSRLAFRRPVTDDDFEHLRYFFESGSKEGGFDSGIRLSLQAILADPEFIFRFERTPPDVEPGSNYRITDLELASRLSFFLWSTGPDDELIQVASDGKLKDPAVLKQQVERLLADSRSETLATNFASHFLHLQNLEDVHPDAYLFPDWDYNLTQSMRRETEMFFDSIVREDRNVVDLLTADYTFADGRLARHYKIPNIVGNRFRRVQVTDENRRGLLGHGSILTLTSMANRTSPVVRGSWLMEVILGTPPPSPPANVPPFQEDEDGQKLLSVRQRMESHRANPACASCHDVMDPLGFSLENFDAVGAWRTKDNGFEIDPSGTLSDGTPLNGTASLREYLVGRQDLFITNFTRNLLMFAMGRVLQHYDMPAVRAIVREAGENDNRFSSFVMGIVTSTPFQMRVAEDTESETSAGQN